MPGKSQACSDVSAGSGLTRPAFVTANNRDHGVTPGVDINYQLLIVNYFLTRNMTLREEMGLLLGPLSCTCALNQSHACVGACSIRIIE
jgi:hypothetical protein